MPLQRKCAERRQALRYTRSMLAAEAAAERSANPRWTAVAIFSAGVAAFAIPLGYSGGAALTRIDSEWYLHIARGETSLTMQPFASRQLEPLLVRSLTLLTPWTVWRWFFVLGVAALLITLLCSSWLLARSGARVFAFVAAGGMYFWAALFGGFMLPDTFSAALLAIFLVCLWQRWFLLAALLLVPMFVARESTILVLACLLVAGWRQFRMPVKLIAILGSLAAIILVKVLTRHALTNSEHLGALTYIAAKAPWNFLSNVLAVAPWSNTVALCAVPKWSLTLPGFLALGGVRAIGICGYDSGWHARLLLVALCTYGLLPVTTLYLLLRHRGWLWTENIFLRFCVLYGCSSFLLAPLLGRSLERLFLYGWPVFVLITPILAQRLFAQDRGLGITWLALHLATAWLDVIFFTGNGRVQDWPSAWWLAAAVLIANAAAWWLMSQADAKLRLTAAAQ
jgi:hypothetical protein